MSRRARKLVKTLHLKVEHIRASWCQSGQCVGRGRCQPRGRRRNGVIHDGTIDNCGFTEIPVQSGTHLLNIGNTTERWNIRF